MTHDIDTRPYMQPSAAWTFWTTFLFGLFGLLPMFLHSAEARTRGLDTSRYGKAFILGLIPSILLWAGIALVVLL